MRRFARFSSKYIRTTEYRRKLFYNNFENGRNKRKILYGRMKPKLEQNSRILIEKGYVRVYEQKLQRLFIKRQIIGTFYLSNFI